jgi:hypothetical protein
MAENNNSIETIKTYFANHNGLQLSNRFSVAFRNLPFQFRDQNGRSPVVQAQEVVFPPRSLETVVDGLQGYGPGRYVPRYQKILTSGIIITFPITNDSFILDLIDQWFNYFYSSNFANNRVNQSRNYILPFYDDAVLPVFMDISILDPNGNPNLTITLSEVFPVETQPFLLSMKTENTYLTYPVVFGYRDYQYNIA